MSAPQPPPAVDPLAGDWSEGLSGSVRALGIPEPKRLVLEGGLLPAPPAPRALLEPPPPAPPAETVEAPDAWAAAGADSLSQPPAPLPSVIANVTGAFRAPGFQPEGAPPDVAPPLPSLPPPVAPVAPPTEPPAAAAEFRPEITPALAVPAPFIPRPAEKPPAESAPPAPVEAPPAVAPAPAAADAAEGVVELRAEDAAEAHAVPRDEPAPAAATPAFHTPGSDAEAWGSAISAGTAPTPWSEPVAPPPVPFSEQVTAIHALPPPVAAPSVTVAGGEVVATQDVIWSAPPPATEPVTEWKAEAASDEWQEIKRAEPPPAAAAAADWSTLSSGPDWSAPAASAPAADEGWGAPPPPPAADAWAAAPAAPVESEWSAPPPAAPAHPEWAAPAPAAEQSEWAAPPPSEPPAWSAPAPAAAKAWGGPPAGASAMEQLESETEEPSGGAAKDLFGSVPAGGSLAGDDEPPPEEDLGPPEELDSPEDVLKPVDEDDDPDLLVPVEEPAPPPPPQKPAQPLAMFHPVHSVNPLEVRGEHRVAVHMRRGGTRRGSLKDVDLAKAQFSLFPQGGGAPEIVYHADVKAVFFMLAPGEKLKPGDGGKVRITFADGRSIEGVRNGPDTKQGFFFVPADAARTNTRFIYVAREALSDVKAL